MMRMLSSIALVASLAALGCGGKTAAPTTPPPPRVDTTPTPFDEGAARVDLAALPLSPECGDAGGTVGAWMTARTAEVKAWGYPVVEAFDCHGEGEQYWCEWSVTAPTAPARASADPCADAATMHGYSLNLETDATGAMSEDSMVCPTVE